MTIFNTLVRQELKNWFLSPVFYAYCVLFSFFSLAAMFLLSGFIEANEAELSYSFFRWHPWILALITPVIGIRSWSEESHCGMFEVLGTQPIRMSQLVFAKAVGAFIVIAISLSLSFPALLTVAWLGEPDLGIIFSGYIGSLLCGCAFVAVSQAVCSYMRVSIGSFVCSVSLCLVLVFCGITQIANIILGTFPSLEWATQLLAAISISPKYNPFTEGRIELASSAGFLLLIGISLMVCQRALLVQRTGKAKKLWNKKILSYGVPVWLALCSYIILALSISLLPGRIDFTEDNRFGLPPSVAQDLGALEREVSVRLFATSKHPDFGFDLARYQKRIAEVLTQISVASDAKVKFELLDPNTSVEAATTAALDEVLSITSDNGTPFIFGLVVESLKNKRVFNVIDPNREQYFVADLVQAILDVGRIERKTIGILTSFGPNREDAGAAINWPAISVLQKSYRLTYLNEKVDWNKPSVIILNHLTTISAELSAKLEAYLKQGGDLIIFVDPLSTLSQRYIAGSEHSLSSDLPEFVKRRGIHFSDKRVVFDFLLKTEHETEKGSQSDPGMLTLGAEQFNPDHAISAGFDFVHFIHAGAFDVSPLPDYDTIELVRSSAQAVLVDTPIESTKIEQAMGELQPLNNGLSLMLLQQNIINENEGRLLLVSDTDWLHAAITGAEDDQQAAYNSNINLAQNMVDFLIGARSLAELRIRSSLKRPLQTWDEIRQTIAEPFYAPISNIVQELNLLQTNLDDLEVARKVSSTQKNRSAQVENQVSELRNQIRIATATLTALRNKRESEIQKRLSLIKWLNVLTVPLLIALIGMFINILRVRKVQGGKHE